MRIVVIFFLLSSFFVNGQERKGPPDLSGNWISKKEDGTISRHYRATQTGNHVVLQCTDEDRKDMNCEFDWDSPGIYNLSGTFNYIAPNETYNFEVVYQYKHPKGEYTIITTGYDDEGNMFFIDNPNDVLSVKVCGSHSCSNDAKFEVYKDLETIRIEESNITKIKPALIRSYVSSSEYRGETVITYKISAQPCAAFFIDRDAKDVWYIYKEKDGW